MKKENTELSFTRLVDAPPEDVFYAFATAQGWRDWLCDSARFQPRPGGSYQLAWNSGWFAAGSITKLERPTLLTMTWRGKEDPDSTQVVVGLNAKGGKTEVHIRHEGFGEGKGWGQIMEDSRKGWEIGLENLESTFKTGIDLRVARRPMLGIFLSDFNESIAKALGVPVSQGVRIDRPVEGMGAEQAGLQANDVLVELAGKTILGFEDVGAALNGKRAGDSVAVIFYRGPEKHAVQMALSERQIKDFPLDPILMAERIRESDAQLMQDLQAIFAGVSEKDAAFNPGPQEWSAKEVLAHLIDSEGYTLDYLTELINDGVREFSTDGGIIRPRLQAMLEVTPTITELLDRLEKSKKEVAALLARSEKLKSRKGALWKLGLGFLEHPGRHEHDHMDQIKAAIEAAREG